MSDDLNEKPVAPSAKSPRRLMPPRKTSKSLLTKTFAAPVDNENPTPSMPSAPRPKMREDDPRARAAIRAAEVLEAAGGNLGVNSDEFYIDRARVPDGWEYEWRRHTVLGQNDPSYDYELARNGWEPVPANRHRDMMPGKNETIDRKGMRLYERPKILVDHARQRELRAAQEYVAFNKKSLAQTSNEFGELNTKVRNNFEPLPIPNGAV
jgi:hypothetical protein